jgi:hypothetical protein
MMVSHSNASLLIPGRSFSSNLTFGTRILLQLFLEQADPSRSSGDHAGEIRSLSRSSGGRHWAKRRSESQGRRKELVTVGL